MDSTIMVRNARIAKTPNRMAFYALIRRSTGLLTA